MVLSIYQTRVFYCLEPRLSVPRTSVITSGCQSPARVSNIRHTPENYPWGSRFLRCAVRSGLKRKTDPVKSGGGFVGLAHTRRWQMPVLRRPILLQLLRFALLLEIKLMGRLASFLSHQAFCFYLLLRLHRARIARTQIICYNSCRIIFLTELLTWNFSFLFSLVKSSKYFATSFNSRQQVCTLVACLQVWCGLLNHNCFACLCVVATGNQGMYIVVQIKEGSELLNHE